MLVLIYQNPVIFFDPSASLHSCSVIVPQLFVNIWSLTGPGARQMLQTSLDVGQWTEITETHVYLEKLKLLCHSQKELQATGYIVETLSPKQLQSKLRCEKCGGKTVAVVQSKPY